MMRNDIISSNSRVNGKMCLECSIYMFAYHGKRQAEAKVPIGERQFPHLQARVRKPSFVANDPSTPCKR